MKKRTDFLISYLSIWPFLTFAKSQAIIYCPVDVTIAFSSAFSPILNLAHRKKKTRFNSQHHSTALVY